MMDKYAYESAAMIRVDRGVSVCLSPETINSETIVFDRMDRAVGSCFVSYVESLGFISEHTLSVSLSLSVFLTLAHSLILSHILLQCHTVIFAHSWTERSRQFMSALKDHLLFMYISYRSPLRLHQHCF